MRDVHRAMPLAASLLLATLSAAAITAPAALGQASAPATDATPSAPSAPSAPSTPAKSAAPSAALARSTPNSGPGGYSAGALYNAANAFVRSGQPGMAILNYERARLIAPNDADVNANLSFVRSSSKLPAERWNWFERAVRRVSPALASWLGLLGISVIGLALLARFRIKRHAALTWLTVTGFACITVTVCNAIVLYPLLHSGVVVAPTTPARVSPVPMGEPVFTLPEGEIVRIESEHDDFLLVRTAAGRSGWVTRANVARIVPETR